MTSPSDNKSTGSFERDLEALLEADGVGRASFLNSMDDDPVEPFSPMGADDPVEAFTPAHTLPHDPSRTLPGRGEGEDASGGLLTSGLLFGEDPGPRGDVATDPGATPRGRDGHEDVTQYSFSGRVLSGEVPKSPSVGGDEAASLDHGGDRRNDWEVWDMPMLKRLRVEGDGLGEIEVEEDQPAVWMVETMKKLKAVISDKFHNWPEIPTPLQNAIILIEMATEAIVQEWDAALFLTKIVMLLCSDDLRAHEDGLYLVEGKAWCRAEQIPTRLIETLEESCKTAAGLLLTDLDLVEAHYETGSLHEVLQSKADAPDTLAACRKALIQGSRTLHKRDGPAHTWAWQTAKTFVDLVPKWSNTVTKLSRNFAKWAFIERPRHVGVVAFQDCILRFQSDGIVQVPRVEAKDVYVKIPVSLQYTPAEEYTQFFRKFMATCTAGNMDALDLECAIESLALRGKILPHHILVYFGSGGNSKGARSTLRAKVFGSAHSWVSPTVFDLKLRDEFRKQGHEFVGAMFCTVREADAFDLDEKVFKCWTAGEGVACRLPFAVHTPMLTWPSTGKFWEMNLKATPRIRSVDETSFTRRLLAVGKQATFTSDVSKVDCSNLVFEADGRVEERLDSGDAVWCYLRHILLPWQREHSEEDARRMIMDPAPRIRADTLRLLQILRHNQNTNPFEKGVNSQPEAGGVDPVGEVAAGRSDQKSAVDMVRGSESFRILQQCHTTWSSKRTVKDYQVAQCAAIPGTKYASKNKKTRSQVFEEFLQSPYNFFFDHAGHGTYTRAPFKDVEEVLSLPSDAFGNVTQWLPYPTVATRFRGNEEPFDFHPIAAEDHSQPTPVEVVEHVKEIGHLSNLRDYADRNIDRRPQSLRAWIDRLSHGTPLEDGEYYEITVGYRQAHNIPGRLIAIGASLQNITKEARAVAVGRRCSDMDFPVSHPVSLLCLLLDMGVAHEFPMVQLYVANFKQWRQRWGKKNLNMIIYGGTPTGGAWNPVTWTLAMEFQRAGEKILGASQFAYLNDLFHDRPRPFATRLYYAVCSHENARLLTVTRPLKDAARGLMYDGFLLDETLLPAVSASQMDGAIRKEFHHWEDNLFMVLRSQSTISADEVVRLPNLRKCCIANSLISVGPPRVAATLSADYKTQGPVAYEDMHRFMLASKTGHHLRPCAAERIINGCVREGFLLHWNEHAVGVSLQEDGRLRLFDDSHQHVAILTTDTFFRITKQFESGGGEGPIFWMVESGTYDPHALPPVYLLRAGGLSRVVAKSTNSPAPSGGGKHGGCCVKKSSVLKRPSGASVPDMKSTSALLKRPSVALAPVLKRPSGRPDDEAPDAPPIKFSTLITECPECGSGLLKRRTIAGRLYGFHKLKAYEVDIQRCWKKSCRANVVYHYHTRKTDRVNLLKIGDLVDNCLMLKPNVSFDLDFLKYHAALHFRVFTSSRGAAWAHDSVFGDATLFDPFRRDLFQAMVLYRAISELEGVDGHRSVHVVTNAHRPRIVLDEVALDKYSDHLHYSVFPAKEQDSTAELCIDGHEKVAMSCTRDSSRKRAGRPSSTSSKETRTNGWLMVVSPSTRRVVGVSPMEQPENKAMVVKLFSDILPNFPKVDCLIYDRMCRILPAMSTNAAFRKIKYLVVDRFHAKKHNSKCPCSPINVRRLGRRIKGVNTSACEQVFSWFRNYARTLNSVHPRTHFFLVLLYCRLHNELVDTREEVDHLPPLGARFTKQSSSYDCNPARSDIVRRRTN